MKEQLPLDFLVSKILKEKSTDEYVNLPVDFIIKQIS
jgi:hypothetical protein